jgi:8-oxo-dGTP pyrophosphatase MutT (NUDIX family)
MKTIFKNSFEPMNIQWAETGYWNGCNAILLDEEGKVILVRTRDGDDGQASRWMFPGGGKNEGETPEQCVRREIREEAQCEVEDLEYIMTAWGELYEEDGTRVTDFERTKSNRPQFRFIGRAKGLEEFIPEKDGFEIVERKSVTVEELPQYITWLNNGTNGNEFYDFLREKIRGYNKIAIDKLILK